MLEPLKRISENVGQAWQHVAAGWREFMERSRDALTRYTHGREVAEDAGTQWLRFSPNWGVVAAEVEQDETEVHVRIELPGMEKKDIELEVRDDMLRIGGEKRFARQSTHGSFTLMERSYGRFERSIALPCAVDGERASARYRDGVLSVTLPKLRPGGSRLQIS